MRQAVAVTAALAVLAGCSGDGPGDTAGPAVTSTASYSPPTEPPPPVPVESPDKTRAGIFVLAWFETLNYGYAADDADPLRQATGLGCFTCMNWIVEVQTQADRDLDREAGFVHVRDLVYLGPAEENYLFRAALDRDPGVLTAPDGTQTAVDAGAGEVVDVTVGISSSSLTETSNWTMKAITAPAG